MITAAELKSLLKYNQDTGLFTWLVASSNRIRIGDIAGCNKDGYILIRVNNILYRAHRLAWLYMTGSFPSQHIDHVDHIRSNNRWFNLRDVSQKENSKNMKKSKNNKSGVAGVRWCKKDNYWRIEVKVDYKLITLGSRRDFFEACCLRKSANNLYNFHSNHGC